MRARHLRRRPGARLGHFFSGVGIPVYAGLRPDGDHRGVLGEHAGCGEGRNGRPSVARQWSASPTTARSSCLAASSSPATGRTRTPRPSRSPTAGSTPATSAKVDRDGFLSITGRKKEILVTAGARTSRRPASRTSSEATAWCHRHSSSAINGRSSARWSLSIPRRSPRGNRPRHCRRYPDLRSR